jgi:hypothetical protein
MFDQAAEHGRFQFRPGFVVRGHGHFSLFALDPDIKWDLSQILPYRSAKRASRTQPRRVIN